MLYVETIEIAAPPIDVFEFLANKHRSERPASSPVRRLDKVTLGPVAVGTEFVEDVRMFPGFVGTIHSRVMRCEPGVALDERFSGAGLTGTTRYRFEATARGTRLVHEQDLSFGGPASIFNLALPLFHVAMRRRLRSIRDALEASEPGPGAGP